MEDNDPIDDGAMLDEAVKYYLDFPYLSDNFFLHTLQTTNVETGPLFGIIVDRLTRTLPMHATDRLENVMRLFLQRDPMLARYRDEYGLCLLHHVCKLGFPLRFVQLVFEHFPPSAAMSVTPPQYPRVAYNPIVGHGGLPLHYSCSTKEPWSVETVRFLLDRLPDSAQQLNSNGLIPLHIALKRAAPIEMIALLLQYYPQGAQHPNERGDLPLDMCISMCSNTPQNETLAIELMELLIETFPEAIHAPSRFGWLPIHGAADSGSLRIVEFLLARSNLPNAGLDILAGGKLPIHLAARSWSDESVLEKFQAILARYPQGACVPDSDGNLAIHYLCSNLPSPNSLPLVQSVLEVNPLCVLQPSSNGSTPLRIAWDPAANVHGPYGRHRQPNDVCLLLLESQYAAIRYVQEQQRAFRAVVEHRGLPDLVVAIVWDFVVLESYWLPGRTRIESMGFSEDELIRVWNIVGLRV